MGRDGSGPAPLPEAVRALLDPLVADPARTVLVCDFDGTLSPIVADPDSARPLDGLPELLAELADRYAVVAVVSGRPAAFLAERIGVTDRTADRRSRVRLIGLYGMESVGPDGSVRRDERVTSWMTVVADASERLGRGAPAGVLVEGKGAAVTVHWRGVPDAAPWVAAHVAEESARSGLVAHPGRLSVELRPAVDIDKGTVVRELTSAATAACFFGDDLGDLPAFAALRRRAAEDGITTVAIAVGDAEASAEVAAVADLVVDGPPGALAVLAWLEEHSRPGGDSART